MKLKSTSKTLVLSILMVGILSLVSVSLAYFTINYNFGESANFGGKASNKDPRIDFTGLGDIDLNNTYPMTDEQGLKTRPYMFTVTNKEDKKIKVDIILQTLATSTLEPHLVNVALDNTVANVKYLSIVTPSSDKYSSAGLVGSYTLEPNASVSGNIRLWINSDGTVDNAQNKTWSSKILAMPSFVE